ncbi:MAG: type II toxin-antitoxin system Phd/YefM family antitoxin [Verrucomicrobia bacterium]|nr:type II toxin-antitoxin system Phd/YefM family antitoxin [Verrucomicrobiota bacterium]MDA1086697.1 type II toxin-antitoxin system Phd/YefM family antitoxin [Verrucomicrobiota bacterium]
MRTAIEPVTALKTQSAKLIRRARETRQPIVITQNGKASVVVQDVETYEEHRKALLLLKFLSQGDQQLKKGIGISHARVKKHLAGKLKSPVDD